MDPIRKNRRRPVVEGSRSTVPGPSAWKVVPVMAGVALLLVGVAVVTFFNLFVGAALLGIGLLLALWAGVSLKRTARTR